MERPDPVPVVRVGRADSHVGAGIAAVLVLLVLAVMKPWALGDGTGSVHRAPAPSAGRPVSFAAAAAGATGRATAPATSGGNGAPGANGADACWPSSSWRIVADERFLGRTVRAWVTADPAAARTPLDPAIGVTRVVSGGVLRLGFCAPVAADVVPGRTWRATVWRVDAAPDAAHPRSFTSVLRMAAPAGTDGTIAPPPPAGASRRAAALWPPGRYVLEVHDAVTPYADAWFAVDIVTPTA